MLRIASANANLEMAIKQDTRLRGRPSKTGADVRRRGQPSLVPTDKPTGAGKPKAFFNTDSGFLYEPLEKRLEAVVWAPNSTDPMFDTTPPTADVYKWNYQTKQWDGPTSFDTVDDEEFHTNEFYGDTDPATNSASPDDIKQELPEAWAAWEALGLDVDYERYGDDHG